MRILIVVDVQNDFMPGGSLAVAEGDKIVPIVNKLMAEGGYDLIIGTADWHPANHACFGKEWPVHCVQNTIGSEFHKDLEVARFSRIVYKGTDQLVHSYSGFWDDNHAAQTDLKEYIDRQIKLAGVDKNHVEIEVCGLALDYCVKYTAIDAADFGFKTRLIEDATRAVYPENNVKELRENVKAGVEVTSSEAILKERALDVNERISGREPIVGISR